jgi:DNA-binding response OmpR family regulator
VKEATVLQAEERVAVAEAEKGSGPACRILLIQADPDLLDILTGALREVGLQVCGCASVTKAKEACRQDHFDMIVVDWLVEGLFADEILHFIPGALQARPLPSVLVLSRLDEADTRECLRPDSHVQGVLTRPASRRRFAEWAPLFAATLRRTPVWTT